MFLLKEARWHLSKLKQDTKYIDAVIARVGLPDSARPTTRKNASSMPAEAVRVLFDTSVSMVSPLNTAAQEWVQQALFFELSQGRRPTEVVAELISAGAPPGIASNLVDGLVQQIASLRRVGIHGWDGQRVIDAEKAFRAVQQEASSATTADPSAVQQ